VSGEDCAQDRRDLWDAVNKQREQGGRIEVALGRIETLLTERCGACTRTQAEHDLRIGKLEDAEAKRKGGYAVLVVVASFIASVASLLIRAVWK
jgi:hypothetical protein